MDINDIVKIDDNEINLEFIRASGPGGQNVNKVATSVHLRFSVRNSPSLEFDVKNRLTKLAGSRMTEDGILLIEAKRYRTQEQNRLDAIQRLKTMILKALEKPKPRRATRPGISAREARVDEKKKRGQLKRIRQSQTENWE
jgi:ribosome-associated protein